jgi:hypothetical protein
MKSVHWLESPPWLVGLIVTLAGCSSEDAGDGSLAATGREPTSTADAPAMATPVEASGPTALEPSTTNSTNLGPPPAPSASVAGTGVGPSAEPTSALPGPTSSSSAPGDGPANSGGTSGGPTDLGGAGGDESSTNAGAPPVTGGAGTTSGGAGPTGGTPTAEAGSGGVAAGGSGTTAPTFHVFLLLGQSNMAGYPKAQEADREEDPRVTVLGFDDCAGTGRETDVWDVAAPPLHECWNDGLGPGDYFAKTLLDVIPEGDTIGLVPCAISGERIETFMKDGGTQYEWILGRARMAQEAGGVIEGLLFHQGESNSGDSSWPGKVNSFVTDLRSDLGIGEAPFLAGELLYTGGTSGHNTLVNQIPDLVTNSYVISAEGLVVDPGDTEWNLHFDHDSVVTFGERYAATMIQALGW